MNQDTLFEFSQPNRRTFLKVIALVSAHLGFGFRSEAKISITHMRGIYAAFLEFALDLGMTCLPTSEWFAKEATRSKTIKSQLEVLSRPGTYSDQVNVNMIQGYGVVLFPISKAPSALLEIAVFDWKEGSLVYVLPWFAVVALPELNRLLAGEGDKNTRADYLIPRYPLVKDTYNNQLFPGRYKTAAGSAQFTYKGDEKAGEVNYTLWKARPQGSLEEMVKTGTLGVEIEAAVIVK